MSDESIVLILGFMATLIGVMTPIIKLNTTNNKTKYHYGKFPKTN